MIGETILYGLSIMGMILIHGFAFVVTPLGIYIIMKDGIDIDTFLIFMSGAFALLLVIAFWCIQFGV